MSASKTEEFDYIVQELRGRFSSRGVRRVKLGGFDLDGVLRGKLVSLPAFWESLDRGFAFGAEVFGWDIDDRLYPRVDPQEVPVAKDEVGVADVLAVVDPRSLRMPAFEPDTAHFLVDFLERDRTPHPACPRGLLRRVASRAEAAGFLPQFGVSYEYWIFKENSDSLQSKRFQDLVPMSPGMCGHSWLREGQHRSLMRSVMDIMDTYGIPLDAIHTETGPGVWEATLQAAPVMEAADRAALFKTTLKQLCAEKGLAATFMAKWNPQLPGSACHVQQSLWDAEGKRNLFADEKGKQGISKLAQHYLGGQLEWLRELSPFYAPFVNSYKRFVPGFRAPLTVSWGDGDRTVALRTLRGAGGATQAQARIEHRHTGADIHPHVAFAAMLGSGLLGIERAVAPPSPCVNASSEEGEPLPRSMNEGLALLAGSDVAPVIMGASFVKHYLRSRRWELAQYEQSVSAWELQRYFEAV